MFFAGLTIPTHIQYEYEEIFHKMLLVSQNIVMDLESVYIHLITT